eukprot:5923855-Prymnesium_polylepis.2
MENLLVPLRAGIFGLSLGDAAGKPLYCHEQGRTPGILSKYMDEQDSIVSDKIAACLHDVNPFWDSTGFGPARLTAVPSQKSTRNLIKFVGQQVANNGWDDPSDRLFLSFVGYHGHCPELARSAWRAAHGAQHPLEKCCAARQPYQNL